MSSWKIIGHHPVMVVALLGVLTGCGKSGGDENGQAALPVVQVITAQPESFAFQSELPGRVEPVRVAQVRARVQGIVVKRYFEEGANVKAGDVLFQIDPSPYEAELGQAQARLAQADAALFEAKALLDRYQHLVKIEAVSGQEFDAAQAAVKTAAASRKAAIAAIDTAKLNLSYARVTAPISGHIGRALVTEGALVGQGEATPMAVIQQLDPVYVDFKQSVDEVTRLRAALADGTLEQDEHGGTRVSVIANGLPQARAGSLLFSDVTVDRDTGQVSLRSVLPNADGALLPGMYVRVRTTNGMDPAAILVPQRAVSRTLDGSAQVLIVGPDDVVQSRPVITGAMQASQSHIVDGIEPGERVVVGSAQGKVENGIKVTVAVAENQRATKH